MTWVVDSSGSQSATVNTEFMVDAPTTAATYLFQVDLNPMLAGDTVELRVYDKIDGSNFREVWKMTYQNPQAQPGKSMPPIGVTTAAQFSIKQTAGTARTFPWVVRRM